MSRPTLRMGHADAVRLLIWKAEGKPVAAYMERGIRAAAPACPSCGNLLTAEDGVDALRQDRCRECA